MKKHFAYDDVDESRNNDVFSRQNATILTQLSHIFFPPFYVCSIINSLDMRKRKTVSVFVRVERKWSDFEELGWGFEVKEAVWKSMCHAYNFNKWLRIYLMSTEFISSFLRFEARFDVNKHWHINIQHSCGGNFSCFWCFLKVVCLCVTSKNFQWGSNFDHMSLSINELIFLKTKMKFSKTYNGFFERTHFEKKWRKW